MFKKNVSVVSQSKVIPYDKASSTKEFDECIKNVKNGAYIKNLLRNISLSVHMSIVHIPRKNSLMQNVE